MSIIDPLLHANGVEYNENRTGFACSFLIGIVLQKVKIFNVINQIISVFLVLSCFKVAADEVIGILENGRVDLMVEKLLDNELIEVIVGFVLFILVLYEIYPLWCLYLNYLRGELITHELSEGLND